MTTLAVVGIDTSTRATAVAVLVPASFQYVCCVRFTGVALSVVAS